MPRQVVSYDDLDYGAASGASGSSQPSTSKSAAPATAPLAAPTGLDDMSTSGLGGDSDDDEDAGSTGSSPGPPHPDASSQTKQSYSSKKRARKKRRQRERAEAAARSGMAETGPKQPAKKVRIEEPAKVHSNGKAEEALEKDEAQPEGEGEWVEEDGQQVFYYYDDDEGDEDGYDEDEPWQAQHGFSISLAQFSSSSSGRVLQHDEVWDDSALVSAWDAAQAEYLIFHSRRAEARKHEEQEGQSSKKSALWYEAPTPGSKEAMEAAKISQGNREAKALLAWQKKQEEAQRRGQQLNGNASQTQATPLQTTAGATSSTITTGVMPDGAAPKRYIPPSIGLEGNAAWQQQQGAASLLPGMDEQTQSMCMSWYYAGYYTGLWTGQSQARGAGQRHGGAEQ
ncbi:hypothetical protein BDZ90DRAFT_170598 [Jaminaea rosea]|uniref:Survival motor neuron Tudor domain-containing protein n=1 Tax=Jaminaea rosea TaxID=1569628 RepID=A0A316UUZ0_9BASI|nr:hypothetical protein BDZ90DRAFT_170598 [Jaminaea rosea]PWN27733.1 hypothetical protein BDZ90DRAFT_170598 [Jaminaea rosea]